MNCCTLSPDDLLSDLKHFDHWYCNFPGHNSLKDHHYFRKRSATLIVVSSMISTMWHLDHFGSFSDRFSSTYPSMPAPPSNVGALQLSSAEVGVSEVRVGTPGGSGTNKVRWGHGQGEYGLMLNCI